MATNTDRPGLDDAALAEIEAELVARRDRAADRADELGDGYGPSDQVARYAADASFYRQAHQAIVAGRQRLAALDAARQEAAEWQRSNQLAMDDLRACAEQLATARAEMALVGEENSRLTRMLDSRTVDPDHPWSAPCP